MQKKPSRLRREGKYFKKIASPPLAARKKKIRKNEVLFFFPDESPPSLSKVIF